MGSPSDPIEGAAVFVVKDIAASLAYYRDALGFAVAFTWGEPATYAGVCRGGVTIHLAAQSAYARFEPDLLREAGTPGAPLEPLAPLIFARFGQQDRCRSAKHAQGKAAAESYSEWLGRVQCEPVPSAK